MNSSSANGRSEAAPHETLRRFVLLIFLFGVLGLDVELLLIGHNENFWQLIPLLLGALSVAIVAWRAVDRRPAGLRALQGIMILFVISGFVGLWLHYKGNLEFELEMYPSLSGWPLFWKTLKGATPVLAPGTMIGLGLLGLIYTYRHPDSTK